MALTKVSNNMLVQPVNRNLIINGAMQVAQRGTSFTFSSDGALYTTVDRFKQNYFGNSWGADHSEITQETDGPDGFIYSCKIKALVAQDYSDALGSWVQYQFENQDIASLKNGNGLKDFTVSLWLKSNKTGNVTLAVESRGYSYSTYVTIDTANTWEYKTVTIPATNLASGIDYAGDPTGAGFHLKIGLGSDGSWLVSTDDQWNDRDTDRGAMSPQQTNFQSSVNDYLQFTGVKLEVGNTATPFDHRSYGEELALCQRYYVSGENNSGVGMYQTSGYTSMVYFPVCMRATPSVTFEIITGVPLGDVDLTPYGLASAVLNAGEVASSLNLSITADAEL